MRGGERKLGTEGEGAELINRTQVGGKTNPLGSSERKLSIEGAASRRDEINYKNPN